MKPETLHIRYTIAFAAVVLLFAGCAIPFDETIDAEKVTLTNNQGYVETAVEIPGEARDPALNYSNIEFRYTVTAHDLKLNTGDKIDVALYVSSDTAPDDSRTAPGEGFEQIFSISVDSATDVSGTASSDLMVQILNDRQESFVIAADIENELAENLITSGTIDIDLELHIEGEINPL
ncbi:MAG: hypothetical protein ACOC0D_05575 [Spirochaeta sp.]